MIEPRQPSAGDVPPERLRAGSNGPTAAGEAAGAGNGGPAKAPGPAQEVAVDDPARHRVSEVLVHLIRAARASQLYRSDNAMYRRFADQVSEAFSELWESLPALRLTVQEDGFGWEGQPLGREGRDMAFLFYKDGVRQLTFLRGFEEEVERFVDVIARARRVADQSDDMLTLLWDADFEALQYSFVDLTADAAMSWDSLELPELSPVAPESVRADAAEVAAERAGTADFELASSFAVTGAEDTLYFLDETELEQVRAELAREWDRDVQRDVLNALFDRLEDPLPLRQREILGILRQLLPVVLARADFAAATIVLGELRSVFEREPAVLDQEVQGEVDALLEELSEPEVVDQLVRALEEVGPEADGAELAGLISLLRPTALPALVRAAAGMAADWLRHLLAGAAESLAEGHPDRVAPLLEDEDPQVVIAAVRIAGARRIVALSRQLAGLLQSTDTAVRRAAVEALALFRTAAAVSALESALEDGDREVRIAAARALGELRYQPSAARLQEALGSRLMREADLTERIAFFEAYGAVAGADAVPYLDQILNGRKLLGRRQPAELRACAARALGRVAALAARTALERAADDDDPVVRNAVAAALKGAP